MAKQIKKRVEKTEKQKLKLLYLRDYLLENSDWENPVTTNEIIAHLKSRGVEVERKTVYADIEILGDYGMEIEHEEKTAYYKVIQRDFELDELQLLIDSVQSSKFVTSDIAKEITDKLKKFASVHDRKKLNRRSYVANRIRNKNDSVFYRVNDIHSCIADDKKLSFRYFTYTLEKKKSYMKKGEFYTVSPFALLWNDNNYYLYAYHENKMKHFRVDKMDNIKVLDKQERDGHDVFKTVDLSERSTKLFSMYGGEEERVTLRFSNHLTGVAIDRFGMDILMLKDGDGHFTVSVSVEVSPQFYGWLCGLGKAVKIVSPDSVVKKMSDYVSGITKMYETDTKT